MNNKIHQYYKYRYNIFHYYPVFFLGFTILLISVLYMYDYTYFILYRPLPVTPTVPQQKQTMFCSYHLKSQEIIQNCRFYLQIYRQTLLKLLPPLNSLLCLLLLARMLLQLLLLQRTAHFWTPSCCPSPPVRACSR